MFRADGSRVDGMDVVDRMLRRVQQSLAETMFDNTDDRVEDLRRSILGDSYESRRKILGISEFISSGGNDVQQHR